MALINQPQLSSVAIRFLGTNKTDLAPPIKNGWINSEAVNSKSFGNIVQGIDKAKVGEVASEIRAYYKPEPYKGKGIRYVGEVVRRKAGKTVA